MNVRLYTFADAFHLRVQNELLLTLSEGLVKVRCMESALALGWTLQEGAGSTPAGSIADFLVEPTPGVYQWTRGARRIALPSGSSADLAVVEPFAMFLEIKCRPDHGTKSQAQFKEMDDDIARVAADRNIAFLFVFDSKIYLSFSRHKTELRGRPPKMSDWFNAHFPPCTQLSLSSWHTTSAPRDNVSLELGFRLISTGQSTRVLAVGTRSDAKF